MNSLKSGFAILAFCALISVAACGLLDEKGPADQQVFVELISKARDAYNSASANAILRDEIYRRRTTELCAYFPQTLDIKNWVGQMKRVDSVGEKASISIFMQGQIWLNTSSVEPSTLISRDTSLFPVVANLKGSMLRGDRLRFSGTFFPETTKCLREFSVTQRGSMSEPEFLFRFTDIVKISK
jgi:hypothetical protein